MKLTIKASELTGALTTVSKIITKNLDAMLDNVLIELKDDILKISASDGESWLTTCQKVVPGENGTIAVPAVILTNSIKELSSQEITLEAKDGEQFLNITWGSGDSRIPLSDASAYPAPVVPDKNKKIKFCLPSKTLLAGLKHVADSIAPDDLRPVLAGVCLDVKKDKVNIVASDAHVLVCFSSNEVVNENAAMIVIPGKPAAMLRLLLAKDEKTTHVCFDEKRISVIAGGFRLVTRRVEGNYPAYETIFPKNNPFELTVPRTDLIGCIKRLAVYSDKNNILSIALGKDKMVAKTQNLERQSNGKETVSCTYDGDEFTIGLKIGYILEILSRLEGENVTVKLADPTKAVLIDEESDEGTVRNLLMPILTQ